MLTLRQHIENGALALPGASLENLVVINFQMCHADGATVSGMMRQLTAKERGIVRAHFIVNAKKNTIRKLRTRR